ncbi:hypothetical protein FQZ97_1040430 [compost metagenome]
MPDGSRATITLSGVDGLQGDILYIREDLLLQYLEDRAVIWFVFGERELRPYPSSPPKMLIDASRQQKNSWYEVLTEADFKRSAIPHETEKVVKQQRAATNTTKKASTKSGPKMAASNPAKRGE